MKRLLLLLLFAVPLHAKQACDILIVNQLTTTEIEVVFDCDLKRTNFTAKSFTVKNGGDTIPAAILHQTRLSADFFTGLHLVLTQPMKPNVAYTLHVEEVSDDQSEIKDKKKEVRTKGAATLNRFIPQRIFATFPTTVKEQASIGVTRAGTPITLTPIRIERTPAQTGLVITLDKPLRHGDKLVITTTTTDNDPITASVDKVEFPKPADRKTAAFYLALNTEAGRYQKPNITLDWKAERRRPLGLWTHAPKADVIVATQDANGTNKATLGWNVEYLQLFRTGPIIGILYDITPSAELEKGLVNRSWMTDATATIVFPTTKHFTFRPTFGVEVGRNFGLKKDYRQFEDFDIRRIKANAYLAWAWDFPARVEPGVQRVSFGIDATLRHLAAEEINSTPIPPSERTDPKVTATYALDDDQRFYGTATLDVKLQEYFGIALEYTYGERPLLFEDNNKLTLKWTFMF